MKAATSIKDFSEYLIEFTKNWKSVRLTVAAAAAFAMLKPAHFEFVASPLSRVLACATRLNNDVPP
jgi:hypothetical protein